jgi:hypothetical protein
MFEYGKPKCFTSYIKWLKWHCRGGRVQVKPGKVQQKGIEGTRHRGNEASRPKEGSEARWYP